MPQISLLFTYLLHGDVFNMQALLNPVQPVLNCLMYADVSSVWHNNPSIIGRSHSNSLPSPSEISPESPLVTPPLTAGTNSPLLIFGDS